MRKTVIDLFSCVGGHALGYMRVGYQPALFCEARPERRDVLLKHFAGVPVFHDIHDLNTENEAEVQVCIGGPPCQQTSVASAIWGHRTGQSLWSEMRRVIKQYFKLQWIVVEQPPGNKVWEAEVQADLERDGWAVQWITISASELGYPHIRRRRFAIAHRDVQRLEIARQSIPSQIERIKRTPAERGAWLSTFPRAMRMADGVSRGLDRQQRIEAIGDSNPPEMVEAIFRAIEVADGQY